MNLKIQAIDRSNLTKSVTFDQSMISNESKNSKNEHKELHKNATGEQILNILDSLDNSKEHDDEGEDEDDFKEKEVSLTKMPEIEKKVDIFIENDQGGNHISSILKKGRSKHSKSRVQKNIQLPKVKGI